MLTGIIIPYDWGEFHNVISIAISAGDGKKYIVVPNGFGRLLYNNIDNIVTVCGECWSKNSVMYIRIKDVITSEFKTIELFKIPNKSPNNYPTIDYN